MLRFNTFWRFCKESVAWWANENECNDSDGKRVRSSESGRPGDTGPADRMLREDFREGRGEIWGEGPLTPDELGCRRGEDCCRFGCG